MGPKAARLLRVRGRWIRRHRLLDLEDAEVRTVRLCAGRLGAASRAPGRDRGSRTAPQAYH